MSIFRKNTLLLDLEQYKTTGWCQMENQKHGLPSLLEILKLYQIKSTLHFRIHFALCLEDLSAEINCICIMTIFRLTLR